MRDAGCFRGCPLAGLWQAVLVCARRRAVMLPRTAANQSVKRSEPRLLYDQRFE